MTSKTIEAIRYLVIAAAAILVSVRADAFELFGYHLFGENTSESGQIAPGALAYTVAFKISPADDTLEKALRSASILHFLRPKGAADSAALLVRAEADVPRLVAALYADGRYGGIVRITIAGRPLDSIAPGTRFGSAGTAIPVVVAVDPGRRFVFGEVLINQPAPAGNGLTTDPVDVDLVRGEAAGSGKILAAEEKLVDGWRRRGHPFAKVSSRDVVADHATGRVDVALTVNPGPDADFGDVAVEGTARVDTQFVRDQTAIRTGSRYTPVAIDDAGERLRRLGVFDSVRVNEATKKDRAGRLPVTVTVSERKPRFIGATASWSSIDGAELEAYWGHRNLFGQAERLRIGFAVSQIDTLSVGDLTYRAEASFLKPGVIDIDTDLFADVTLLREHPDPYLSESATAKAGLTHRYSKTLSGSLGVEVSLSTVDDAFGTNDYVLVGLPGTITYDSRDNPLDATRGIRAHMLVEPFYETERSNAFVLSRGDLSGYRSLDEAGRIVAAARLSAASFVGADLEDIPANRRFFGGGGGSIRGYAYRNVGPRRGGEVVGGRSMVETSAELRYRVNDTFGVVPFIDAGAVSTELYPGSDTKIKVGVGIGLRYYTILGPIRFDFAIPLDPESGDGDFAIYAGLGQVF
jgi:translocation and assembly module TamA